MARETCVTGGVRCVVLQQLSSRCEAARWTGNTRGADVAIVVVLPRVARLPADVGVGTRSCRVQIVVKLAGVGTENA